MARNLQVLGPEVGTREHREEAGLEEHGRTEAAETARGIRREVEEGHRSDLVVGERRTALAEEDSGLVEGGIAPAEEGIVPAEDVGPAEHRKAVLDAARSPGAGHLAALAVGSPRKGVLFKSAMPSIFLENEHSRLGY